MIETTRFPHLVVVEGDEPGRVFALTKPTTIIGRDPSADIVLPHPTVSWRHAALTVGATGIVIEDLGSLNGTFVGVGRIGRRVLADGDLLAIGHRAALKLTFLSVSITPPASDSQARARAETPVHEPIPLVANAAALVERLRLECALANDTGASLLLMFVRIAGASARAEVPEALMRRIAGACRAAMDADDLLARASGREFILLLRKTIGRAIRTAEKIRSLTAQQLKGASAAGGAVIATAALVPLPAHTGLSAEGLLLMANRKAGRGLRRARHDSPRRAGPRATDEVD